MKEKALSGLRAPRLLAPHTSNNRWPRLNRQRTRLVFSSTREDVAGDIWITSVKPGLFGARLKKLTGNETADVQPAWHPGGRKVFFASAPSLGERFQIWQYDLDSGTRTQLTEHGGQMPDCSPDGRYLVFASAGDESVSALWVMRLSDRAVARLTEGSGVDLFPCWDTEGKLVFFCRLTRTACGSGEGSWDAASIYSARFDAAIFKHGRPSPAQRLTSGAGRDVAPRPLPGGFLYASDRGGTGLDVWCLPAGGEAPDLGKMSEFLDFARSVNQREPDTGLRLLAWQNVLWAARDAEQQGHVVWDLPAKGDAAEAPLRMGEIFLELGRSAQARKVLEDLLREFPYALRFTGMARLRLLEMERADLVAASDETAESAWQGHLRKAAALAEEYDRHRRQESAHAREMAEISALAQLETALSHRDMKQFVKALEALSSLKDSYPEQEKVLAHAALAQVEIFKLLGQPEQLKRAYLNLLTRYPHVEPYSMRAAALAVRTAAHAEENFEKKLAALRALIEQCGEVPVLPALAQNRIADLCYEQKDYYAAKQHYRRTIQRYPRERREVAAAYLALARIEVEQKDFAAAARTCQQMLAAFREGPQPYRARARGAYVNAMLQKAQSELMLGDFRLALNTYVTLEKFDASLVCAHRGIIDCYARTGRIEEAILKYRPRAQEDSADHIAHYALARAYSYYGPANWAGSSSRAARRVAIDRKALRLVGRAILARPDVPYYRQLRGFLFNRIAAATDDPEMKTAALDSYVAALSLSAPEQDRSNYAALLLNVGEGYMLTGQYENAYRYYRKAMEAGFSFAGAHGEAALAKIGRCASASGHYDFAKRLLADVLRKVMTSPAEEPARQLLRKARVFDELALVHQLAGDWAEAAGHYRKTAEAVQRLMELAPGRRAAYRKNLLRANRNLAIALYCAVEDGAGEPADLARAYNLLKDSLTQIERVGVVEGEEGSGPGLITIDIQVGLGKQQAAGRFDVRAEKRLLYTYLARIGARAGNYREAADFLRRKLDLYEKPSGKDVEPAVLTEQAIILSQMGECLMREGREAAAAEALENAMDLDRRALNLQGEMQNALSLGRLALRIVEGRPEQWPMGSAAVRKLVRRHMSREQELLQKAATRGLPHLLELEAALNGNLAALGEVCRRCRWPVPGVKASSSGK